MAEPLLLNSTFLGKVGTNLCLQNTVIDDVQAGKMDNQKSDIWYSFVWT